MTGISRGKTFKCLATLLFTLALALQQARAAVEPTAAARQTYQIANSQVTSTPSITSLTNTEIGTCVCDLTVGRCDLNCRCDTDCTAAEIAQFSGTAKQGPEANVLRKCVNPDVLRVNAKGSLTANVVNNLLCIEADNSPAKGFFINSPTSLTTAEFDILKSNSPYSLFSSSSSSSSSATPTTSTGSSYTTSTIISRAQIDAVDPTIYNYANPPYLPLPTSGFAGICSDLNPVSYGVDVPSSTCTRSSAQVAGSTPASACAALGPFDASVYFKNFLVAGVAAASISSTSLFVPVAINQVTHVSADGATSTSLYSRSTDLAGTPDLFTTVTSPSSLYTFPAPTWIAGSCTCANVVKSVSYNIAYRAAGSIAIVLVDVVLTDVTAGTAAPCLDTISYDQTWKAFFTEFSAFNAYMSAVSSASPTAAEVATTIRGRSGSPGYLPGKKVLAGTLTAVAVDPTQPTVLTSAIKQQAGGLSALAFNALGACLPVSTAASTSVFTHGLSFGYNSMVSCSLSLTLAELSTLCTNPNALEQYLTLPAPYIGKWGNSSYLTAQDWTLIDVPTFPTSTPATYAATSKTCTDIVDALNIEIATADFGSVSNPQRSIIAARASWGRDTWAFTNTDVTQKQEFQVKVSIKYLQVTTSTISQYVPSGPPIVPKLPSDFLYPFYVGRSSATVTASASSGLVTLLAIVALAMSRYGV